MYSTPKYKANIVKSSTSEDETNAKVSAQNTRWESTRSRQKNHLPKSIKKKVPFSRKKYNSFKDKKRTVENVKIEP